MEHAGEQVAFSGEALARIAQVELQRMETAFDFIPFERRGHRSAGVGAQHVGRGDGLRARVLQVVEIDAVFFALRDRARRGKQLRLVARGQPRDQVGEVAGFLEAVTRLDGDVDVHAVATGRLGIAGEADAVENLLDHESSLDNFVEVCLRLSWRDSTR